MKKFSGTIGKTMSFVASLEIETNIKTYGPYGKAYNEDPFSIPLPENVGVVGFFGRAGRLLDAIGVYIGYTKSPFTDPTEHTSSGNKATTSSPPPTTITGQVILRPLLIVNYRHLNLSFILVATLSLKKKCYFILQTFPIKIGMWGGGGGAEFDVIEPPKYLDSVMIRSGDIIDSFGFSYIDQAGQKHTLGPYGGNGGNLTTVSKLICIPSINVCSTSTLLVTSRCTNLQATFFFLQIKLEPSEYVMIFSGTTGTFVGSPVIASIAIETNLREYGPYGKEQDEAMHFSIPLPEDASIVGFFGSAGNLLDAIGVYVNGSIPN